MRWRALVVFPFAVAAIFVACVLLLPWRPVVTRVEIESVKSLALVGCALAAFSFDRGDYLRRAWLASGTCIALLIARDVTLVPSMPPRPIGIPLEVFQDALVFAANASSIAGTWMMARAWRISGLEPHGSESTRRTVVIAGIVVALLVGGATMVLHTRTLLRGNLAALAPMASDLGDVVSLCLIAPVALTALGMAGGVLRWPWGLITASLVCWLLYDVTNFFRLIQSGTALSVSCEVFRSFACTFTFSAGLAQRFAVRGRG